MSAERDPLLGSQLQAIGKNLRSLRRERSLSQEDLADKAGLHRTYIGSLERGERNVAIGNLFALASALDVTVTELIGGSVPCPDPSVHDSTPAHANSEAG